MRRPSWFWFFGRLPSRRKYNKKRREKEVIYSQMHFHFLSFFLAGLWFWFSFVPRGLKRGGGRSWLGSTWESEQIDLLVNQPTTAQKQKQTKSQVYDKRTATITYLLVQFLSQEIWAKFQLLKEQKFVRVKLLCGSMALRNVLPLFISALHVGDEWTFVTYGIFDLHTFFNTFQKLTY